MDKIIKWCAGVPGASNAFAREAQITAVRRLEEAEIRPGEMDVRVVLCLGERNGRELLNGIDPNASVLYFAGQGATLEEATDKALARFAAEFGSR